MEKTGTKRAGSDNARNEKNAKRTKSDKQKSQNWKQIQNRALKTGATLEPGDQGILVTCQRGTEMKAVGETLDLFNEYAEKLYGKRDEAGKGEGQDIEDEIDAELKGMQDEKKNEEKLFRNVYTDTQCILLIKTKPPVEPAGFVRAICRDAMEKGVKRTRFLNRLAPMNAIGKASVKGLDRAAREVLKPHFHEEHSRPTRYAIRPNLRNHSKDLDRDILIKQVADLVGPEHKVDLKGYEVLIVAEVYKNLVGLSVVGSDFEELKRYNLSLLYDVARQQASGGEGSGEAGGE